MVSWFEPVVIKLPAPPPHTRRGCPFLSQGGHHEGVMLTAPTWLAAAMALQVKFLIMMQIVGQ